MSKPKRAHYIMLGGFLGAGKTTCIAYCARKWHAAGKRLGIICNDQAAHLVDTVVLSQTGVAVEEIAGACFCCRFQSLQDAAENLQRQHRPEIFLAEPVGSCTDLVATVSYPMRRMYGDNYSIAPLTVVLDPQRALRIFGLREGKRFSEKVAYIYRKQIEEAAAILINKIDMFCQQDLDDLRDYLHAQYPDKEIFMCSAHDGTGLDAWMEWIEGREIVAGTCMDVDYDIYADGEAALGWYNASVVLRSSSLLDGNALLDVLMASVQSALATGNTLIAHLKMTLATDDGSGEIASANIVDNESLAILGQKLTDDVQTGSLTINVRAECSPEQIRIAVENSLSGHKALHLEHQEYFRPGRPEPEHRMQSADSDQGMS